MGTVAPERSVPPGAKEMAGDASALQVRGKGNASGIGVVEVYFLQ
jgi:hypothetical protein